MEEKTFLVFENETGQVEVRDETVTRVAALAALGVEGVDSLGSGITADTVATTGLKKLASGVEMIENDGLVDIYIAMVVNVGTIIPDACRAVQEKVRSEIEDMLGVVVGHVNIRVASIKVE